MRSVTAGTGVAAWRAGCNKLGKVTVSLSTSESAPANAEADVLVIGVIQAPDGPSAAPGAEGVDDAIGGTLADAFTALGATGELEELSKIPGGGKLPAALILAVGLGAPPADGAPFDAEKLRRAAGTALRDLAAGAKKPPVRDAGGAKTVAVALPARTADEAEAVTTGALLGGYSFRRYRSGPARDLEVTVLTGDGNAAAVKRGEVIAGAVNLVRDLVNTAPLDLSPETLAEPRPCTSPPTGGSRWRCSTRTSCARTGTAASPASARDRRGRRGWSGSPTPIRRPTKTVAFVGKGITFDSGGLSLKPPKSMETMKSDMGGAAAMLAATAAIAELGLPVNVVGYMCARGEHAGRRRAAAVGHHHHLRRQDRRGAEHRRRGPAGDGGRAGQVRRRQPRRWSWTSPRSPAPRRWRSAAAPRA